MNKCILCGIYFNGTRKTCSQECRKCLELITKNKNNFNIFLSDITYFLQKYNRPNESLKRYKYCKNFRSLFNNLDVPKLVSYNEYINVLCKIENMEIDITAIDNIPNSPKRWKNLGFNYKSSEKISNYYNTSKKSFILRNNCDIIGTEKYNKWKFDFVNNRKTMMISHFSMEYWIKKGYSKDRAKSILKKNSTRDLNYFIEKYGEIDGEKKYDEMRIKRSKSSSKEGYIKNHGIDKYNKMIESKRITLDFL